MSEIVFGLILGQIGMVCFILSVCRNTGMKVKTRAEIIENFNREE